MATPPTRVSDAESAFNTTTSPKSVTGVAVTAGDLLVIWQGAENSTTMSTAPTFSGTATVAAASSLAQIGTGTQARASVWKADVTGSGSVDVSMTRAGTAVFWGGGVVVLRNHNGTGTVASAAPAANSVAPSLAITTAADNSGILYVEVDFNAVAGARTFRQINALSPTVVANFVDTAHYGVDAAWYTDAGLIGAKTAGISSPSTMCECHVAVEVKPAAAGGVTVKQLAALGVG